MSFLDILKKVEDIILGENKGNNDSKNHWKKYRKDHWKKYRVEKK